MTHTQATNKYRQILGITNYMLALAVAFTAAFPSKVFNIAWTLWLITWALEGRFLSKRNFSIDKSKYPVLLLGLFFLWEVLSLLWAKDINAGISVLERQFSFIAIVPIALFGVNKYYKTKSILISLIAGTLVSLIAYYMSILYVSNYEYFLSEGKKEMWKEFSINTFQGWSSFIKHRLYYCTIIVIALFSVFFLQKNGRERYGRSLTFIISAAVCALFFAMIITSGSRSSILVLAILLSVNILNIFQLKYKIIITTIIVVLFSIAALLLLKFHPRMSNFSLQDMYILETGKTDKQFEIIEPRLFIWHEAYINIDEYWGIGKGVGNSTSFLIEKYKEQNYPDSFLDKKFSPHNQYLSAFIDLGILGFIFLVAYFLYFHRFFKGRARKYAINLTLLIGFNLLTEGMLGRSDGIITMCFFTLLCIWMQSEQENKSLAIKEN